METPKSSATLEDLDPELDEYLKIIEENRSRNPVKWKQCPCCGTLVDESTLATDVSSKALPPCPSKSETEDSGSEVLGG